MKIILVAAISRDGFIADESGQVTSWTSKEDQDHFAAIKAKHNLYVMGSKTFEDSPQQTSLGVLRVILTRHPEQYADLAMPGQREFRNLSPQEFVESYQDYKTCLLLGGSHVYQEFLDAGLVDEAYITEEPVNLENGTPLLTSQKNIADYDLVKSHSKPLNSRGTTLSHYKRKSPT